MDCDEPQFPPIFFKCFRAPCHPPTPPPHTHRNTPNLKQLQGYYTSQAFSPLHLLCVYRESHYHHSMDVCETTLIQRLTCVFVARIHIHSFSGSMPTSPFYKQAERKRGNSMCKYTYTGRWQHYAQSHKGTGLFPPRAC